MQSLKAGPDENATPHGDNVARQHPKATAQTLRRSFESAGFGSPDNIPCLTIKCFLKVEPDFPLRYRRDRLHFLDVAWSSG
jgi:hypothetical protein